MRPPFLTPLLFSLSNPFLEVYSCILTPLSRQLLSSAIQIYSRTEYFKGELARAKFTLSEVLKRQMNSRRSLQMLEEAKKIRDGLTAGTEIPIEDLKESDVDELVVFWKV